ncbi:MAG: ndhD1 [Rickettsiaceae bacterium]|jgi:NADH-quinone oxidoreductase subunit M|nr:ndhD1 [Rickettsiaceae bacterium]
MAEIPILSISIAIPFFSALFILIAAKGNNAVKSLYIKYVAILSSIMTLICASYLIANFEPDNTGYLFEEKYLWIKQIGLHYHLGIDGLSMSLIFLTALLTLICIIASLHNITTRSSEFLALFLLLESLVIGAFSSLDILLFYIFFETTLIPMYLIIGIWGGENRIYAAIKFFLYTLLGSVFFLCAIIYIYMHAGTLSLTELENIGPSFLFPVQQALFLALFASFAVKVPMFPFHTWLPHAHVQAPTAGSVILAGILLKLGAYGFLRFSLPILPDASLFFAPYIIILSIIAVIYASFVAYAQEDMKKMIAYSSVAHMGFVTAGIFSFNQQGLDGAIFQMISHGIISGALFLAVGALYDRMHTKAINAYGGVASRMPILATFFMVFTMGSVGLPGTSGFVGEFLSIVGVLQAQYLYAFFIALGVVLGAVYMLTLYRRVMLGEINNSEISKINDLDTREIIIFVPLVLFVIYLGVYPSSLTELTQPTVTKLIGIMR